MTGEETEIRENPGSDGSHYHITGKFRCIIGGYHGEMVSREIGPCQQCGIPVCPEHRGLHWERTHKRPQSVGRTEGIGAS